VPKWNVWKVSEGAYGTGEQFERHAILVQLASSRIILTSRLRAKAFDARLWGRRHRGTDSEAPVTGTEPTDLDWFDSNLWE